MNNHLKLTRTLYILNLHVINIINKLHKCHIYPNQCSNLQHLQILIIFFENMSPFYFPTHVYYVRPFAKGPVDVKTQEEWVIESYSNSLFNSSNINITLAGLPSCRGILFYPKN